MTAQIDRETIKQLSTALQLIGSVTEQILSSLTEERWVTPLQAEAELGIPSQTIRYLARNGKVSSRLIGKRRMEVLLSDLQARV